MFEKRLKQEDLEELRKRVDLINQHILIEQALEMQKQIYIKNLLPKYGLDMNKNYELDLRIGKIRIVKSIKKK